MLIPDGIGRKLDYCWICGEKLLDAGGSPEYIRNEHHVIPQACGGVAGPLVSLDSAHHDLLHLVAEKMLSNRPYAHLLDGLFPEAKARLLYLSERVVIATKFTENDPNKKVTVNISLSNSEIDKLKSLATFYGMSRNRLFQVLLEREHKRVFPTLPQRKS